MNHSKLLESDFYEDMFEGSADDDYRPNCKPNKNDDDTIKFGGLDPCQVHVQIMDILHASGRKTKTRTINHFYCPSNSQKFDFTEFRYFCGRKIGSGLVRKFKIKVKYRLSDFELAGK